MDRHAVLEVRVHGLTSYSELEHSEHVPHCLGLCAVEATTSYSDKNKHVGCAMHTLSEVEVAANDSYSAEWQAEMELQARSAVELGAFDSNCSTVHSLNERQTASDELVGESATYSPTPQTV